MNIQHTFQENAVRRWAESSLLDPLALSLSRFVASAVDWRKASFSTLVAAGLSESELLDFRTGGKNDHEPSPDEWLLASVGAIRKLCPSFLIVEDWRAKPNDRFLSDMSMPARFLDGEVYYVVDAEEPSSLSNWGRICSNAVPLFHGFVIAGDLPSLPGDFLSAEVLRELATRVRMMFFGVYDGESYLLASMDQ